MQVTEREGKQKQVCADLSTPSFYAYVGSTVIRLMNKIFFGTKGIFPYLNLMITLGDRFIQKTIISKNFEQV